MTPSEHKALVRELELLPAGTLVKRTIRGAERFYHQWREDGRTRSRYLTRDEADELRRQVMRKRELKRLLAERDDRQLRHLIDREKLSATEHRYGEIAARTVLYRGRDFRHPSGVIYRNVGKYLMSL